jgi:hypothetical protein
MYSIYDFVYKYLGLLSWNKYSSWNMELPFITLEKEMTQTILKHCFAVLTFS